MLHRLPALLLILLPLLGVPACSTNPATGERQLNFMSTEQEISLGSEAEPQFLQSYGGEIPDPQIQSYVSDLGQRLAAVSERPDLPWEFHAVNSEVINAFALPGGKIFITRGLISQMNNEAQLAGVLGHEVGHVTAQHIGQQMSRRMAIGAGVALTSAALGIAAQTTGEEWLQLLGVGVGVGGTVGGSLYALDFGRDQESQADELGLRYMTKLGYNPLAQVQVMEILAQAGGGGGGGPEFLATHPYPETRIKRLHEQIEEQYPKADRPGAYKFGEAEFQRKVLDRLDDLPPPAPAPKQQ